MAPDVQPLEGPSKEGFVRLHYAAHERRLLPRRSGQKAMPPAEGRPDGDCAGFCGPPYARGLRKCRGKTQPAVLVTKPGKGRARR